MQLCAVLDRTWTILADSLIDTDTLHLITSSGIGGNTVFVTSKNCFFNMPRSDNFSLRSIFCLEPHEAIEVLSYSMHENRPIIFKKRGKAHQHWIPVCRFEKNILKQFKPDLSGRIKPYLVKERERRDFGERS